MITLYTAVGKYELEHQSDGSRTPVIYASGKRHEVIMEEFILWSSLIWNIHTYDELEQAYNKKETVVHIYGDNLFDHYLNRMIARGLIVSGTDYTAIDALYKLTQNLYVAPIKTPIWNKIRSFCHLTFVKGLPFKLTQKIFASDRLTADENKVLSLAMQSMMSTAELIKCVEVGLNDASNEDVLVDALYSDDITTYKNISIHSRFSEERVPVLSSIVNLYLKKMVVFESAI